MECLKKVMCRDGSGRDGEEAERVAGAGGRGLLETEQEYRERWRSIYVIYFTMFQMSLGFSIVLTGVWPYLDKVHLSIYHRSIITS